MKVPDVMESDNLQKALRQGLDSAKPQPRAIELKPLRSYRKNTDIFRRYDLAFLRPTTFQTIGARDTQEDAFDIAETYRRSASEVCDFLSKMFNEIQDEVRKKEATDGATANITYISRDNTVTVANAGDARTVLLILNTKTGKVETKRLSYDNIITGKEEQERIIRAGGTLEVDRQSGRLGICGLHGGLTGIARGFGDFDYPGVTHVPDITQIDVKDLVNDPDQQVFVVQTSDGAYQKGFHEQDLAQVVEQYFNPPPKQEIPAPSRWSFGNSKAKTVPPKPITSETLAEKEQELARLIAAAATAAGSKDNITVNVVRLAAKQSKDLVMGVFDGHDGAMTANIAKNTMYSIAVEQPQDISHALQAPSGKINIPPSHLLKQRYPILVEMLPRLGTDVKIDGIRPDEFELVLPKEISREKVAEHFGIRNKDNITTIQIDRETHRKLIIHIKDISKTYMLDGKPDDTIIHAGELLHTGTHTDFTHGKPAIVPSGPLLPISVSKALRAQKIPATFLFYRLVPTPTAWFSTPEGTSLEAIKNLATTLDGLQSQEGPSGSTIHKIPMDHLVPVLRPTAYQLGAIDKLQQTLGSDTVVGNVSETHVTFALGKGIKPDRLLGVLDDMLADPPLPREAAPHLVDVPIKELAAEYRPVRFAMDLHRGKQ